MTNPDAVRVSALSRDDGDGVRTGALRRHRRGADPWRAGSLVVRVDRADPIVVRRARLEVSIGVAVRVDDERPGECRLLSLHKVVAAPWPECSHAMVIQPGAFACTMTLGAVCAATPVGFEPRRAATRMPGKMRRNRRSCWFTVVSLIQRTPRAPYAAASSRCHRDWIVFAPQHQIDEVVAGAHRRDRSGGGRSIAEAGRCIRDARLETAEKPGGDHRRFTTTPVARPRDDIVPCGMVTSRRLGRSG